MTLRRVLVSLFSLAAVISLTSCANQTPIGPNGTSAAQVTGSDAGSSVGGGVAGAVQGGPPGYEPAYYGGQTVTINAIDLAQNAPDRAQADFYEVVYPIGWQDLGIAPPQCNPCDHEGNGIDFTDYHDHILDSIPSDPGHGEYRALWHVYVVLPAYNQDPVHDGLINQAYVAHLPLTSEQAIDDMLALRLPDGSPVSVEVDTNFYFLCAVVNGHAAH